MTKKSLAYHGCCLQRFAKHAALLLFLLLSSMFTAASGSANFSDALNQQAALSAKTRYLPVNQAFILSATAGADTLQLHWDIAEGYYLYQQFFKLSPPANSPVQFPPGINKHDDVLGHYQVYETTLDLEWPLTGYAKTTHQAVITYQGCAKSGYCYPPVKKMLRWTPTQRTVHISPVSTQAQPVTPTQADPSIPVTSEQDKITQLLAGHQLAYILFGFFSFGLLLAFTPCVLPMVPIVSSLILGEHQQTQRRSAWRLTAVFVLSMATTYAIAGIAAGFLGYSLQAIMQKPWVIISFSLLFVILALALFDCYTLELPSAIQNRAHQWSTRQRGGHYVGVALMGVLSTLIVSPCVAPPLVGALAYISQSHDAILGGLALFMMGLGMGVPLLLLGIFGDQVLPKAGAWMDAMKHIMGFILLAMAVWLLTRITSAATQLMLWGSLSLLIAVFFGAFSGQHSASPIARLRQSAALLVALYGVLLITGGSLGHSDPWQPLRNDATPQTTAPTAKSHPLFQRMTQPATLQRLLAAAKAAKQPVVLDFYADWCVSCQLMEKHTFRDPGVIAALQPFTRLQFDVTKTNPAINALQQKYNVFAPPALLFFAADGHELKAHRIVGEIDASTLIQHLQQVQQANDSE